MRAFLVARRNGLETLLQKSGFGRHRTEFPCDESRRRPQAKTKKQPEFPASRSILSCSGEAATDFLRIRGSRSDELVARSGRVDFLQRALPAGNSHVFGGRVRMSRARPA